jgi:hypothetical protein
MIETIVMGAVIFLMISYKIFTLCYASKCKIFKCNCKDGLVVERDTSKEVSIRHLNDNDIKIEVSK